MLPLHTVREYADAAGYTEVQFNPASRVIGFVRDDERVNVYFTTGTVGTCVNHPTRGKTQLFRRNQSLSDLWRIFNKPRVHTGAGYYRRASSQHLEPSTSSNYNNAWHLQHNSNLLYLQQHSNMQAMAMHQRYHPYFAGQGNGSTWYY